MPKATKPKVNKSAFIRSQPASLSASEVVEAGKKAGIKFSVAQVYTARSAAKTAKPKGAKRGPKPGKASRSSGGSSDFTSMIRRIALDSAITAVEAELAKLKSERAKL